MYNENKSDGHEVLPHPLALASLFVNVVKQNDHLRDLLKRCKTKCHIISVPSVPFHKLIN